MGQFFPPRLRVASAAKVCASVKAPAGTALGCSLAASTFNTSSMRLASVLVFAGSPDAGSTQ
ncbi:hypothetical protein AL072_09410 [Azospirillum thiophilum]|uniref:Uncharacterized protein n=1 Tax=Azospirillum thiophilum TaxID=528244 RepID=A0AAC8ZU13_9PROT|nr:hypothetical protein AL072_09410 [Azospirillum thiophilum]